MDKKKLFLKIYFWIIIVLISLLAIPSISLTLEDIAQIIFTYIGFIALFGYAYNKKFFNQMFWKYFTFLFFIWEIGCYIFITGFTIDSLIVFLLLIPKYWSIVCYTFFTHESDTEKKKYFQKKAKKLFNTFIPFTRNEPA